MIPHLSLKSVINSGACQILRVPGNSTAALMPYLYIIFVNIWIWVEPSYLNPEETRKKAYFFIDSVLYPSNVYAYKY
jgi:hypothetical protein